MAPKGATARRRGPGGTLAFEEFAALRARGGKRPDREPDQTAFSENEGTRRTTALFAHLKAAVAPNAPTRSLSRVVAGDRAGDPEEQKELP